MPLFGLIRLLIGLCVLSDHIRYKISHFKASHLHGSIYDHVWPTIIRNVN